MEKRKKEDEIEQTDDEYDEETEDEEDSDFDLMENDIIDD